MKSTNRDYLTETLFEELNRLEKDQAPNFGLMTPQHMVEHLTWTTKMFSRRKGAPTNEPPSKAVLGFHRFVEKGCPFEHRPKPGVTKADLKDLKYNNLAEATEALKAAIAEYHALVDGDPTYKSYHPMTGEFDHTQMDLIISRHAKWHTYQFGLRDDF